MNQYSAEWQEWHDARLRELAKPFGWLSLRDLVWLDADESDPSAGTYSTEYGVFRRDGDWVHFDIAEGVSAGPAATALSVDSSQVADTSPDWVTVRNDRHCMSALLRAGHTLPWIVIDTVQFELINVSGHLGLRRRDSRSPLLARFFDVPVFPISHDWVLPGHFTAYLENKHRTVPTAQPGMERTLTISGMLEVEIAGVSYHLLTTGDIATGLYVSFYDPTNSDTTAAWRQVSLGVPDAQGNVIVDFNRSVNDPCAFTPYALCPAPVPENVISIPVTAGERRPTVAMTTRGLTTPVLVVDATQHDDIQGDDVQGDSSARDTVENAQSDSERVSPAVVNVAELLNTCGLDVTMVTSRRISQEYSGSVSESVAGYETIFVIDMGERPSPRAHDAEIVEVLAQGLAWQVPLIAIGAHTVSHIAALVDRYGRVETEVPCAVSEELSVALRNAGIFKAEQPAEASMTLAEFLKGTATVLLREKA